MADVQETPLVTAMVMVHMKVVTMLIPILITVRMEATALTLRCYPIATTIIIPIIPTILSQKEHTSNIRAHPLLKVAE